jgi:AraC-like DNA-binding protein
VSIRVVRSLLAAVEQAGGDSARVLAAAGIAAEALEAQELRLSCTMWHRAVEAVLDDTRDPAFALHWAESLTESAFSPLSNLVPHAANLGDAMGTLAEFQWLLSDDICFRLCDAGPDGEGQAQVQIPKGSGQSVRVQRFIAEMILVGLLRLIRMFKPDACLNAVSLDYPAPSYVSEYVRLLGPNLRFAQPLAWFRFDRALLTAVAPHRDADLHDTLRSHTEQRLMQLRQRTSYAARVRELLIQHNGPRHISMLDVARALGLAERTLRRRLVEEGTSYDAVSSAALASIATSYLLDRRRTIQETAFELGFTDRAAFHRAFKRWTGTTPALFRKTRLLGSRH